MPEDPALPLFLCLHCVASGHPHSVLNQLKLSFYHMPCLSAANLHLYPAVQSLLKAVGHTG